MKWRPIFSRPQSPDWRLPTMISLAVFLHGLAFYLIQASPPLHKIQPMPSARVGILDENRSADLTLLRWIENHDPASITRAGFVPPPPVAALAVPYQPSYQTNLPEPLSITLGEKEKKSAPLFPPGPVPPFRLDAHPANQPSLASVTRVRTSDTLKLLESSALKPPKVAGKALFPTQFLVVFSSTTEKPFYFLTQTSGDDRLDDYARNWLFDSTVSASEGHTSGWATIYWGHEVWPP